MNGRILQWLAGGLALALPALATAQQGSDRFSSSATGSVTTMNGGTGYFSDTVIRPFVTGFVPVVGSAPPTGIGPTLLDERLQRLRAGEAAALGDPKPAAAAGDVRRAPAPLAISFSGRGEASVAEIKVDQTARKLVAAAEAKAEVAGLMEKARGASTAGKPGVARIYLQQAARRASAAERAAILEQIEQLK